MEKYNRQHSKRLLSSFCHFQPPQYYFGSQSDDTFECYEKQRVLLKLMRMAFPRDNKSLPVFNKQSS